MTSAAAMSRNVECREIETPHPIYFGTSASTMNELEFVDFMRVALISVWAGESFQLCAFPTLSNAIIRNRNGATPSSPVI